MADEAAAKGKAAFLADRLEEATQHSTSTIALAPDNHLHYCRSPMYVFLRCYFQLLADAEKAVDLKADHTYGYFVLCSAHLGLGNTDSAVAAYKKSLTIGPSSEASKAFLAGAQKKRLRGWKEHKRFLKALKCVKKQAYVRGHQVRNYYRACGSAATDELGKAAGRWFAKGTGRRKGTGLRGFHKPAKLRAHKKNLFEAKEDSSDLLI